MKAIYVFTCIFANLRSYSYQLITLIINLMSE